MTDFPTIPPHVNRLEKTCYLVICRDGVNSAEPRATHLKGHLDHVEKHWTRYVTAGPIREPGGDVLVGAVFLVLADSLEDAKTLMEGDPYITSGMASFVLMLPLILTSINWAVRWLGPLWSRLHLLTYPVALLAAVHFIWVRKGFQIEPILYLGVITGLLA